MGCAPSPERPEIDLRAGGGSYAALSFDDNPGALDAYLYVPADPPTEPAPLVVAMHACTQNAAAYRSAGWEELADTLGFFVLYPEQRAANNSATCFNWAGEYGDPTNLVRGQGENASIISMIDAVEAAHAIDDTRIYAAGHSAGGAQVALMLATWPDVFAAGGVFAGIPYHCTTTFSQVSTCLSPGIDKTPEQHAALVLDAFPSFTGTYPRLSIWHGSADFLVHPMNQTELLEQWATVHGIDLVPDFTERIGVADRAEYHDAAGNVILETVLVEGGGHATFNAPSEGCGSAGAYFEDRGLCGPALMADFWQLGEPMTPETTDGTGDDSAGSSATASGGSNGSASGTSDDGTGAGSSGGDDGEDPGGGDGSGSGSGGTVDADDARPRVKGVGQCAVGHPNDPEGPMLVGIAIAFAVRRRRRRRLSRPTAAAR
jgi:poly(hydroxyalkanoate) depolymerase family esterase